METTAVKRYKTFEYNTQTQWVQDRIGSVSSEGKPPVDVASPPEFKGVAGKWTPEDLFVAAIEVCQMTTFLAFASRAAFVLKEYKSSARGVLEFADGGYRFTRVILSPRIVVGTGASEADVRQVVEDAHKSCLIGRSVTTAIEVEPTIEIA
jgi:organic hydroperoxide reductase OsmC/OhrA